MSKPFDALLKGLLETSPSDWPVLLGQPRSTVDVIDADVSTFSGATDKVLRVHGPTPYLLQLDFQAGPDASLPRRLHVYNGILEDRHDLSVRSVAVLLRPAANLANLTGLYERDFPGEEPYLRFRYQVLRVWKLPAERFLAGGLGTLPLALISAVQPAELPGVIERMKERLQGRGRSEIVDTWAAGYTLLGLRYEEALADQLLQGVTNMEESTTYRAILAKGEAKGKAAERAAGKLREQVLIAGFPRWGVPDQRTQTALDDYVDVARLEQLLARVPTAAGWYDLLGLKSSSRSRRRKTP
jgi:predicted transposase YdaD